MAKSIEEICIQKIEAGIRAIKNGTKTPQETECGKFFTKLKPLNEGMYDDLMNNYKAVVKKHNDTKSS